MQYFAYFADCSRAGGSDWALDVVQANSRGMDCARWMIAQENVGRTGNITSMVTVANFSVTKSANVLLTNEDVVALINDVLGLDR